jgi:hypothetical protein
MVTLAQLSATRGEIGEIGPAEARNAVERGEISMILDVREPNEFRDSHLPAAVNIPRGLLEIRADPNARAKCSYLRADSTALVCCCSLTPRRGDIEPHGVASAPRCWGGGLNARAESGLRVEHAARSGRNRITKLKIQH